MNLYHLSTENHDGETFKPRVPKTANDFEDKKGKRICFASTISGAWRAHPRGGADDHTGCTIYNKFYVHVPAKSINKRHTKIPRVEEVPDVSVTDEIWVTKRTKMKCIGIIQAGTGWRELQNVLENGDDPSNLLRYKVHFKWIKKFN